MLEKLLGELYYMTHGVQIISFIGLIIIVSSFLAHGEKKMRILNAAGSVFAIVYSLLDKQWSNLYLNIILLGVNGYHLIKDKLNNQDIKIKKVETVDNASN